MALQLHRAYLGQLLFCQGDMLDCACAQVASNNYGVESSFASVAGVLRTRVGYAGGTTDAPTYARISDHTEITELQFDPSKCSYEQLLDWFFDHHDPTCAHKKQYQSAILWVDDLQREMAEKALQKANKKFAGRVRTYVRKLDKFYQAEDYHQKYWLRTQTAIFSELNLSDAELVSSTLAAKLNAFLGGGFTDFAVLRQLQKEHQLSAALTNAVEQIARAGGVGGCH